MRYKINDQLRIRRFTPEDLEAVHAYASQPIVSQYQSWGPNSESDSKQFIHDALESELESPRRRYVFAVTFPDDHVIGAGELVITDTEHKTAEIGYILSPDEWGNGYATFIANFLLEFGFEKLELHRITATCDPRNAASERVLQKVGMTKEGQLRETVYLEDHWRDSLIYGMLDWEWQVDHEDDQK